MSQESRPPGNAWLEIIRRPTAEAFAEAFAAKAVLDSSVGSRSVVGAESIRHFFEATREMYETIAFVHESVDGDHTFLEWEGTFQGKPIAGTTILTKRNKGPIESIRLYHRPYDQVVAFSAELAVRLEGKVETGTFHK
jgi:hypothetical protein